MKLLLSFPAFLLFNFAGAQRTVDVSKNEGFNNNQFFVVNGEPFVSAKYVRFSSGTPYFKDQWMKARGASSSGSFYRANALKLNLIDNEIVFLDANGKEMVCTVPLTDLQLTDTIAGGTYHLLFSSSFTDPSVTKGWYLEMVSGKASLFQFFAKQLQESKPYGSATTEQSITTQEQFRVLHNDKLQTVKKQTDLLKLFTDKQAEMTEYLRQKSNRTGDNATQLASAVYYYNSLF